MEVKWRFAEKADISAVAAEIREIDRKELDLAGGWEPLEALQHSFETSEYCRCIELGGRPVALFGVRRPFLLSRKGLIWLLGAKDLAKMKKTLLKIQ